MIGHSANMAVRRDALLAIGGFDERIGPGTAGSFMGEDADVIHRLLCTGATAVSGTGSPVEHVGWRSTQETRLNLFAYERGAGNWIGKALRADRRSGVAVLRARADTLRVRFRWEPGVAHHPIVIVRLSWSFVRGLLHGLRLGPWIPAALDGPTGSRLSMTCAKIDPP